MVLDIGKTILIIIIKTIPIKKTSKDVNWISKVMTMAVIKHITMTMIDVMAAFENVYISDCWEYQPGTIDWHCMNIIHNYCNVFHRLHFSYTFVVRRLESCQAFKWRMFKLCSSYYSDFWEVVEDENWGIFALKTRAMFS